MPTALMARPNPQRQVLFNTDFEPLTPMFWCHIACIQAGGRWKKPNGEYAGMGNFYHYKEAQKLLWPEKEWHKWNDLLLKNFLDHRIIGVIGPASSGKTREAADFALISYYSFSDCSTILVSSTEREMLEMRVWGEMKKAHKLATSRMHGLPGILVESRQRLITDDRSVDSEGRDFRNGACGVACRRGGQYVGLSSFIGVKNKHILLVADEGAFMPRAYVDAISNLNKNKGFKCIVLGNPKETTDALGVICEPSAELGGWDGGIDQAPMTKTWPTRFKDGICVQLVGSDCPNMDVPKDAPVPYPFLITREAIEADVAFYGMDSIQYSMMNEGRMPRGQGLRRVITRAMCLKFGAMEAPIWKSDERTRIGFLDAAYGSVGGDRCVFGELQIGKDPNDREILAVIDTMLVPVTTTSPELPEDQIALFVKTQCEQRHIKPEDVFFDSTGRGSLVGAFARLWSAHVGTVEFGGKPSERYVSDNIRVLCKDYYSKFVTELWYSVALTIQSGQFRGMTEDILLEGSMREWGFVSGNKIEVEPKDKMKVKSGRSPDCFVAGTMILTVNGEKPIETIAIGDLIVTPFGCSPVVAFHESEVSELNIVEFSNGRSLCGKGKHKIFTWDSGWVRLDALSLTNECESVDTLDLWHQANSFFTRRRNTGFKAMVDIIQGTDPEKALRRSDFYTGSFGPNLTDQSQMDLAFTIKMGIGRIINCPILCWHSLPITCLTTCENASKTQPNWNDTEAFTKRQLRPQNYGTNQQLDASGIGYTLKMYGSEGSKQSLNNHAWRAANRSRHSSLVGLECLPPNSVLTLAGTDFTGRNTEASEPAKSAVSNSSAINSKEHRIVPVSARQLRRQGLRKVYNLTLLEDNVYYANGVLVSNCFDALACGVEGARRRGFHIAKLTNVGATADNGWRLDLAKRMERVKKRHTLNYAP